MCSRRGRDVTRRAAAALLRRLIERCWPWPFGDAWGISLLPGTLTFHGTIIIIVTTSVSVFDDVIVNYSHCESSTSSSDECRSAPGYIKQGNFEKIVMPGPVYLFNGIRFRFHLCITGIPRPPYAGLSDCNKRCRPQS